MKDWRRLAPSVLVGLLLAGSAAGELIPTPDFSQHPIPTAGLPAASAWLWEYLDVAILLAFLALATYWALVTRWRRGLFWLSLAALLWFGFVRQGCVCSIGATQNITLAVFRPDYVVPLSVVAFFVLPLLFTVFFGRTFCASVCPLGAVQELVAVRSLRVPRWLDHTLSVIPYVYLGAAVLFAATGTAFVVCRYDPFVAFFRLSGNANMVIFGVCLLLVAVFVGRPYCRYLCPYGGVLAILSKFARWHVRIPPEDCINCRLCEDVCPYGAIEPATVDPTPGDAVRGKRQLGMTLVAAPILVGLFAALGLFLGVPLSRLDPEVQLAEQLRREEQGLTQTTTDATEAFRNARRPIAELYSTVNARQGRFRRLGIGLGAWVGVVLAVKLVSLSIRRRRVEYRPNQGGCVSCGRCFWYCPVEQVRLGLIESPAEVVASR